MTIANLNIKSHTFLADMVNDPYFPHHLVEKGQAILLRMCERIENKQPHNLVELYAITHAATEEFNDLAEEFYEADSEIETVARDAIATDMKFISEVYGFDADIEELVAPRDW